MGGSNPYIEEVKYKPATKKYKVTFLPSGKTIEVDPEKVPYGHNGLPGSILDISEGLKAGLDHACGGVCACSTCHVIFKEGLESCNEATDAELDELDMAPGITPKSRLGCQAARRHHRRFPIGTRTTPRSSIINDAAIPPSFSRRSLCPRWKSF
jgi:2Fe-2S ferredoxin